MNVAIQQDSYQHLCAKMADISKTLGFSGLGSFGRRRSAAWDPWARSDDPGVLVHSQCCGTRNNKDVPVQMKSSGRMAYVGVVRMGMAGKLTLTSAGRGRTSPVKMVSAPSLMPGWPVPEARLQRPLL